MHNQRFNDIDVQKLVHSVHYREDIFHPPECSLTGQRQTCIKTLFFIYTMHCNEERVHTRAYVIGLAYMSHVIYLVLSL